MLGQAGRVLSFQQPKGASTFAHRQTVFIHIADGQLLIERRHITFQAEGRA